MKRYILLLICVVLSSQVGYSQKQNFFKKMAGKVQKLIGPGTDVIVKHDGSEIMGNVTLVTDKITVYKSTDSNIPDDFTIDNEDIYMIKFSDRGNMFINEYGKMFFDDGDGKIPDDATAIYLARGEEIIAYNMTKNSQNVKFSLSKNSNDFMTYPINEVFMIKYPNMANEIVTEFIKNETKTSTNTPIGLPQEEFVELSEAKPAQEYIIKTLKNATIRALVVYGNETFVSYYRKEAPKGPLYRMNRSNMKSLTKVANRRR